MSEYQCGYWYGSFGRTPNLNLCKFHRWTNEHLVNRDKLTIGQMIGTNLKSSK